MLVPTTARLAVVRHAESEGNVAGVVQGDGEYPLSERGRAQAALCSVRALELRPVLVASSALGRAVQTAELLFGRVDWCGGQLNERKAGAWEGRLRADLERAYPGSTGNDDLRPAEFEDERVLLARAQRALRQLLDVAPTGLVAVIGHGAVMRVLERGGGGGGQRFAHLDGMFLDEELLPLSRFSLREA